MSDKTITKTGHHDIAEILLKVALKHQKIQNFFLNIYFKFDEDLINMRYFLPHCQVSCFGFR